MAAVRAGDEAPAIGSVQDLEQAAGADPVQAVQDLGLPVEGIVALVADLALQLLGRRGVHLGLRRAHLGLMFWSGEDTEKVGKTLNLHGSLSFFFFCF